MKNYFIYFVLVFSCFMLFINPVSYANFTNSNNSKTDVIDLVDKFLDDYFAPLDSKAELVYNQLSYDIASGQNYYFEYKIPQNAYSPRTLRVCINTSSMSVNNALSSVSVTGPFTMYNFSYYNNKYESTTKVTSQNSSQGYSALTSSQGFNAFKNNGSTWYVSNDFFDINSLVGVKFIPSLWGSILLNGVNFNRINFNRSIGTGALDLGYFIGYENYNLDVTCGPYVSSDVSDNSFASCNLFSNGNIKNGNKIFLREESGRMYLYINTPYYLYEQGYNVLVQKRHKDESQFTDLLNYNFVCLPLGDNRSSGDFLVNPNLNSTVDLGFVGALDSYIQGDYESSEGNVNGFYGGLLNPFYISGESGDFFGISGELIERLGLNNDFVPTDNEDLFLNFIENLKTSLLNTSDTYITFEYRGNNYTFYSRDFTTPNGAIKIICSVLLTSGLMFLLIQQYWRLFKYLRTLDFISAINSFNVDVDVFM